MKFYTNFIRVGNCIHVRGYNNGKKFHDKVEYNPTLYLPSQKPTEYKTLDGKYVLPVLQGSMRDANDFIKQYENVDNFNFYGSTNYPYVYINEIYQGRIDYDIKLIRIANIDIEVGSENGFPQPASALEPITAIAVKLNDMMYVFGCGQYNNYRDDIDYKMCRDEKDLIEKFLQFWREKDPDVITGWNIKGFDIPYLYNRILRLFDDKMSKKLSPIGIINEREYTKNSMYGQEKEVDITLGGISTLDYIELYKKFTYAQQESYRLDNIATVELGEKKLDYSEFGNLHQLYKLDYQKFIEYNIRDVELVDKLEDKMKLIEMALALAYDAKVNYPDVFTQVRMWDCLTHNYLMERNIVVPQKRTTSKDSQYAGAYVKDPIVGMHEWIVSLDLNSLYPSLIQQYNISPETMIGEQELYNILNYVEIEMKIRKIL